VLFVLEAGTMMKGTFIIQDASHKIRKGDATFLLAYQDALQQAAKKRIPMLVCNPDKVRPDSDKSPMPGTIGVEYEQLLAKEGVENVKSVVFYVGKPFSNVYEIALRNCTGRRVCMVGDALETDIAGGEVTGIDSIWVVNNGIHKSDVECETMKSGDNKEGRQFDHLALGCSSVLQEFNKKSEETYARGRQLSPTVVLPYFRW
jgi:ribonucleotide monophosphatase NagD (HAD superfamily)